MKGDEGVISVRQIRTHDDGFALSSYMRVYADKKGPSISTKIPSMILKIFNSY